jgi:aminoglycoside phosphotransferase (APT) family kinase protein
MNPHELPCGETITSVVSTALQRPLTDISIVPLRGGIVASVVRTSVRYLAASGRSESRQFVVKEVDEKSARREAGLYRRFASLGVTPKLIADVTVAERHFLVLEYVRAISAWPWSETANTLLVLDRLAMLHRAGAGAAVEEWDYEGELASRATATADYVDFAATFLPELPLKRYRSAVRRVTGSLPAARTQLASELGTTTIHGDVHSGNIILRESRGERFPLFLDWARSRPGSPLEDVSSWLLSLRSWEAAAERQHDTLLRGYLSASGIGRTITPSLRDAYWIAGASNSLAGALTYQLARAGVTKGRARSVAVAQAHAALRTIRRADDRLHTPRRRAAGG